jgi:hypothetical protein
MERLTEHQALQELLGAYALDAVDLDEAAAIERHLPTCPRCRSELADHREVAGLLGYGGSAAPVGLWDRIVAGLEEPPPALRLTPEPPPRPQRRPSGDRAGGAAPVVPISRRPRRKVDMRILMAVATAAAVVVAVLGIAVGRAGRHNAPQPSTPNLLALAFRAADANPTARHLTLSSTDGARTMRAVILTDGTTFLGQGNLASLPQDQTYQMWGIIDGTRVSLGVLGNNPTYAAFTTPATATVLAMTVEHRGGVVSSTKAPVILGQVPA